MRALLCAALMACTFEHGVGQDIEPSEITVGFVSSSSEIAEVATVVMVRVELSAASTSSVDVDYTIGGTAANGTAISGGDFVASVGTISFAPGEVSKSIRIEILADSIDEPDETIDLNLAEPSGARLGASRHTITIKSAAGLDCAGDNAFLVCFPKPANVVRLAGEIDTDSSICASTAPVGWIDQPASCFIVGRSIEVAGISVFGSRPLVLFASDSISITGNIDAASHRAGKTGPGAPYASCVSFIAAPVDDESGAGGGAGGTFMSKGGDGGVGTDSSSTGGQAPAAGTAPTHLRAGCSGQQGGASTDNNGGEPGIGGGALYIAARGAIMISAGVAINASGAGGDATTRQTGLFAGGGGGGSGGMIKLHAGSISANGAFLMANGGGGASGSDHNDPCFAGGDPTSPMLQAPGADGGGGDGGLGFAANLAATNGRGDGSDNGGGGGGGGGGYVESNVPLTGAMVSKGG